MKSLGLLIAAVALAVAAGCSGNATHAWAETRSCPVTVPNGRNGAAPAGFNHGNGSLWVALWRRGELVAGTLPEGSSRAEIKPDGSVDAKLGWWRDVEGELSIQGRRLDATAPPLRAAIPQGDGARGFQPSGLTFPTEGCWQVTGSAGEATLRFVTLVVKRMA